ncbi:hypothetical protein H9Y04_35980 [Streptomyces sp. TRM66268-LWL]|uniref:Uncharacterized protein n=1 Tax=Streptomyces polyasparticus TaxID=2767826 RepID=A0ABR7SR15_9ACTN|nr:hypothetical protein [Streptomyces polyasparticus]MBC9717945.1 hypothetical protein [Streptomyces polyasparticus]
MAFSADELRVLKGALAIALKTDHAGASELQDCLRLAYSLDEAVRESERLRAFLLDDLARYRQALPGSTSGYLELLADALAAGYRPVPDDLAALRALRGNPRAAALLDRCRTLAEASVRAKLSGRTVPVSRTRLLALPGGRAADEPASRPQPARPAPPRPVPTPAEVFPPKRRPAPDPSPQKRAAG